MEAMIRGAGKWLLLLVNGEWFQIEIRLHASEPRLCREAQCGNQRELLM
jgi:hypothetical protein